MKTLITAAVAVLIASQAFAGSYEVRCKTEVVPVEETTSGSPEEVLGGAIIGGLLGHAVTDDEGGALVGAIIGGAIANEGGSTTTNFREVETCAYVFIPELISDIALLKEVIQDLNIGRDVSKEMTMDVQYTIGVAYDGVWGPMSRQAAEEYLASLDPEAPPADAPLFSLMVNDVVIVSSTDVAAIDEIKKALALAGVESIIFVDLQ